MSAERAETGRLQQLLSQVGAGLDRYLKFDHQDALRARSGWKDFLNIPLPLKGVGIDQVARELVDHVIPNGSPVPRPGFSAFITTGATTASTLAATAANIASPQRYMITAFNFLEELSLEWMANMFGLGEMKGVYSSGGSVANLIALGAARQDAFEKIGRDPAADGIDRAVSIYASQECHHTIQRSGGVLGIGRRAVRLIACDPKGRMRVDKLQQAIEEDKASGLLPMAVVANAGTTNTGAIDPLQAIGETAAANSIWFHVDGAYGLPGILDEKIRPMYRGLELADSVIVDPHKWLGASVGIAATFVRDRQMLYRAFTQEPSDYLEGSVEPGDSTAPDVEHSLDDFGIPYFDYGVELSAPCRGVVVWALIREIGVDGIRERIQRHNEMARLLAASAKAHPKLEVLSEPTLSICCFRYLPSKIADKDRFNRRLHRLLVRENEYMPSTTRVSGKLALRPCYIGARANPSQVDGLLQSVVRIGEKLEMQDQDDIKENSK
jgi:aromatic-L-amino-acid decarboxylase